MQRPVRRNGCVRDRHRCGARRGPGLQLALDTDDIVDFLLASGDDLHVHDVVGRLPEGSAAEVAACQADAQTLEAALEAYMVEKGSFPSPAPWSAATYAANFEPLTAAGGGGPYLPRPPDTRFYVIEYDSSGHVWIAPPGSYGATYNPGQSFDANIDVCLAAVR